MTAEYSSFAAPVQGDAWVQAQCDQLLDGIVLPFEVRAQVLEVVRADANARRALVRANPERFSDQIDMLAQRDQRIRQLLSSEGDRAQFDATAARWNRIRAGEEPPPSPACARGIP